MGILKDIGIVVGEDKLASTIFEKLHNNFLTLKYTKPSEYVEYYWTAYEKYCKNKDVNNNQNGKVFEYVLST